MVWPIQNQRNLYRKDDDEHHKPIRHELLQINGENVDFLQNFNRRIYRTFVNSFQCRFANKIFFDYFNEHESL